MPADGAASPFVAKPYARKGNGIWKAAYLDAFGLTGNVTFAAEAAGISTRAVERARQNKAGELTDFGLAEIEAKSVAIARLETEAHRRAVTGVLEPVVSMGRVVTIPLIEDGELQRDANGDPVFVPLTIRKYSDTLLITLLKGNAPAKYRENIKLDASIGLEATLGVTDDPRLLEAAAAFLAAAVGDGGDDEPGGAGASAQPGEVAAG